MFFLFIGVILTGLGGYLDMTKLDNIQIPYTTYTLTKQHLWNDGAFFLFLGTATKVIFS